MTPAEMRELIRKLRADASVWGTEQAPLYAEAATALDELLARVEGMEEALRPFAQLADAFERAQPGLHDDFLASSRMSDLRKARAALSGGE